MIYSDFYLKKSNKIPTGVALLIVVGVMYVLSRFFLSSTVSTRANPTITNSIEITNLSSNQGLIIFESDAPESAWVIYGTSQNKLDKIAGDVRDLEANKKSYRVHYIAIKDLTPETKYFYKIVSNNKIFAKSDATPFEFKTLPVTKQTLDLRPIYGRVVTKSGAPAQDTIIILRASSIQPLSAITKNGGDFVIPLTQIFEEKTNELHALSNKEVVTLEILNEAHQKTQVKTTLPHTSPLPETITIGQNYDFTANNNVLSASSKGSSGGSFESSLYGIIFPKENALIPDTLPLIKGRAYPESEINLVIQGVRTTITQKIKAQQDSSWKFSLPKKLAPGNYSITFTGKNVIGKTFTQKRSFSIIKSGESVLGEATPEASPTVTATPTAGVILSPTLIAASPTIAPTATPAITVPPTTPSPTVPTPPQSGNSMPQTIISSVALILGGIGLLLFAF